MLQSTQVIKFSVLFALMVSLTACGFHLRGATPLPEGLKKLYMSVPNGSFETALSDALKISGAEFVAAQSTADLALNVSRVSSNRQVATLDERGKVNSYRLILNVVYSVNNADGSVLSEEKTISDNRLYDFDPNLVVESEFEEAELLQQMEQEIAYRIVRQLSVLTRATQAQLTPQTK